VQFAAEDLQLLYQIAIQSRRDLDYAPDARAGFEMALLRMLAFRPATVPPAAAAPAGGSARPKAARASVAPAPVVTPAPRATAPAAGVSDWAGLVTAMGLQGPTRQFAAHCVLLERRPGVVRLQLDPAGESFRRPQIESRIAQLLGEHFGEAIRLEIVQAESPSEIMTPARHDQLAATDRQRAAEQAIETDPAVLAMREVFGASVRPGSTKPL
jgi:DNA polymerase-3 subunit gamma/tau